MHSESSAEENGAGTAERFDDDRGMRLVVTGYDGQGRSTIVSDGPAIVQSDPSRPGFRMVRLWEESGARLYPSQATIPTVDGNFPPIGGLRASVFTFPPGHGMGCSPTLGMHSTDTTDLTLILTGSMAMTMGDGGEVRLSAGDAMLQHGTVHEWRNPYDEPCTYLVVLVGAGRE